MNKHNQLTVLEQDMLKELFNLGVGRAAKSLSQMVNQEILLSVPDVKIEQQSSLINLFGNEMHVVSVTQSISGPFEAESMLVFSNNSCEQIVRLMLGNDLPGDTIKGLQEEALSEMGNVVLNACMGSISKVMETIISVDIPVYIQSNVADLFEHSDEDPSQTLLLINIDLRLKDADISLCLTLVFSSFSLKQLKSKLTNMVNEL